MHAMKAGVVYFALVFGAGFVLGTIRTLWVVAFFGARKAELMEMPSCSRSLLWRLVGQFCAFRCR
jgi:hypothetical protein